MQPTILSLMQALRHALHACPEISGQENKTRALLLNFLQAHTSLPLHPCGGGFYAVHRESQPQKPSIALRADYDALALPNGGAAHLCGHDGHATALCGVALLLEGQTVGRDVFLLFQPAEETGVGAQNCLSLFEQEAIGEIYGAHNLPGLPLGQVTTRPGTFACASRGLTLSFTGRATHAAYPEHGISPALAMGQFLCNLPHLSDAELYKGMTLCTVIGVQMGEKAFGAAAAQGEIWLTLRGEQDEDLEKLDQSVCTLAETLAQAHHLKLSATRQDVFPATVNHPACTEKINRVCQGVLLPQPMRWSEDFGHYLHRCPGAFFGIGAGEEQPPLHTEHYEYPDALLSPTIEAFWQLICQ